MQEVRRMEQRGVGENQRFPNRCVLGKSSPGSNHCVSWIVWAAFCVQNRAGNPNKAEFLVRLLVHQPRGPSQEETTKTTALFAAGLLRVPGGGWRWNECVRVSKHCRAFPKPSLWMEKPAHDGGRGSISKLRIVLSSAWLEATQWLHLFKDIFKHFLQVSGSGVSLEHL